jgi:gliding motility-associated-like protein
MGLWPFLIVSLAQNVSISGVPNHYLKVNEVLADRVKVSETIAGELDNFVAGDKVLIIQMTGVTLSTADGFKTNNSRTKESMHNAGRFEILQVDEVIEFGGFTYVVFTDNLSNTYDAGEKIQLVKFVEGETVTITGQVTPMDWDGQVGGIVAIIGTDSVKLNSNIDASTRGFRGGAVPTELYSGICRNNVSDLILDTLYFFPTELNRSGNKGEGIITASWPYTKGAGFNVNGGGAGNGMYSGGGGGSNYNTAGDGGLQAATCTGLYSVDGGWGGYACQELYSPASPRVIMGGGGGSGTKRNLTTLSKGGNGGGLVILITGALVSNGSSSILAKGENAINTVGSGGGGGAGGTILVDATNYSGTFSVSIRGGNGGRTTDGAYCTGSGGGGSGGVLWHSGTFISSTVETLQGINGSVPGGCFDNSGYPGTAGVTLANLITPLTGFLFNTIRGTDTVCAGQIPNMLIASQPKGGDGTYLYFWEQSTNNVIWSEANGNGITMRTFQPSALNQTTWYRRVVTSDGIFDTSRVVKIFVYPAIGNNSITGTDTICYDSSAKLINGTFPNGGNNASYGYQWQLSNNQSAWVNSGTVLTTNIPLNPGRLTDSKYYRRIVTSTAYCRDTSNAIKVTVLPLIANNGFASGDTAICINQSPGQLDALVPAGGDGNYSYSWQYKILSGSWTTIPASNEILHTPGLLSELTTYRRIVFSGNDNACIDTGIIKTINIMPLITNNSILGDAVQFTCYDTPITLSGSQPRDGFGTYSYQWEQSSDNSVWEQVIGIAQNYETLNLTNTQYFRRIVFSTPGYHECADISDAVEVRINPLPTGDVINRYDTLCAGETLYVKFNLAGNGPFKVTVEGLSNQTKSGIYTSPDSIAFIPASTQVFTMYTLEDDSGCLADNIGFTGTTHGIIYDIPVAYAGEDDEACGDLYTPLKAVKSVSGSMGIWTATGASFGNPENTNSDVVSEIYGPNVLTWTETNWHCTDADDVKITFYEQPQSANAGTDQALDFNYTTQLQAVPASVGKGQWTFTSGSGEIDNDTLPNAIISEITNAVSLKWTVINGNCPAVSDSIEVLINPLVIKKGFTPNGDNKNDFFDIGAVNAEQISIKVFNSVGGLVFESDNYRPDKYHEGDFWDGTNLNGVELPEGTYFYLINIKVAGKKEDVQFRSFVEILR